MSWFDNLQNAVEETSAHVGKIAAMVVEKDNRIAELERQLAEARAIELGYQSSLCNMSDEIARLRKMVCPKIDCQTCNNFSSSCYQARKEAK